MGSGWDQDGIGMGSGWDQDGISRMGVGWEQDGIRIGPACQDRTMQVPPLLLFPWESASPQERGMPRLVGRAHPCRNLQLLVGYQHSEPLQRQPAPECSRIPGKSILTPWLPVEERVGGSCLCKLPREPGMELMGELRLVFPPAKSS